MSLWRQVILELHGPVNQMINLPCICVDDLESGGFTRYSGGGSHSAEWTAWLQGINAFSKYWDMLLLSKVKSTQHDFVSVRAEASHLR